MTTERALLPVPIIGGIIGATASVIAPIGLTPIWLVISDFSWLPCPGICDSPPVVEFLSLFLSLSKLLKLEEAFSPSLILYLILGSVVGYIISNKIKGATISRLVGAFAAGFTVGLIIIIVKFMLVLVFTVIINL